MGGSLLVFFLLDFSYTIAEAGSHGNLTWQDNGYPLVMTNSSPWFFDGPNRNRWFTELENSHGGSFHGKL